MNIFATGHNVNRKYIRPAVRHKNLKIIFKRLELDILDINWKKN